MEKLKTILTLQKGKHLYNDLMSLGLTKAGIFPIKGNTNFEMHLSMQLPWVTLKYWGGSLIIGFWRLRRVYLLKQIDLRFNVYSQEMFLF